MTSDQEIATLGKNPELRTRSDDIMQSNEGGKSAPFIVLPAIVNNHGQQPQRPSINLWIGIIRATRLPSSKFLCGTVQHIRKIAKTSWSAGYV